jgi:hypothetical protein
MAPSEFWRLTMYEFFLIWKAREPVKIYGSGKGAMTETEVREIYEKTYGG